MSKSELIDDVISHHGTFKRAMEHMRSSQTCHADVDYWTHELMVLDRMKKQAEEVKAEEVKAEEELNIWHMMAVLSFFALLVSFSFRFYIGSIFLFFASFCFAHFADRYNRS